MKEVNAQTKVSVSMETLWQALSKDIRFVTPKSIPHLVKQVELIEGDGGPGTILLFHFGSDVSVRYQREKIVEFDEGLHQIGLEVIEGGRLEQGFTFYVTTFQLSAIGEQETLVNIKVSYESDMDERSIPSITVKSTLTFLSCLEKFLMSGEK